MKNLSDFLCTLSKSNKETEFQRTIELYGRAGGSPPNYEISLAILLCSLWASVVSFHRATYSDSLHHGINAGEAAFADNQTSLPSIMS